MDASKSLRKGLGVTVLAPRTDLSAASHWVPGSICPFYLRVATHGHCPIDMLCNVDSGAFVSEEITNLL